MLPKDQIQVSQTQRTSSLAFDAKRPLSPFVEDAVDVFLQPELAHHPDYHDGWCEMRPREVPLPVSLAGTSHAVAREENTPLVAAERAKCCNRRRDRTPHIPMLACAIAEEVCREALSVAARDAQQAQQYA